MTTSHTIENKQKVTAIVATDLAQESTKHKNIAEVILKESDNYGQDADNKFAQALEYKKAADDLMARHRALNTLAQYLKRNKDISLNEAVKALHASGVVVGRDLATLIPKDATPEQIEEIAEEYKERARKLYFKASELEKEAEESRDIANKLRDQVKQITEQDGNFSELRLKHVVSKSQQLKKVFEKLGIYKLDAEYKAQLAAAEKRAQVQL